MDRMRVIYGRNWLPFSIAIRLVTWSRWSHCGIVSECGQYVYESTFMRGVVLTSISEFKSRYHKTHEGFMPCMSTDDAYAIAKNCIGNKYDRLAVFGILFKTGWNDAAKFLCSEFVAYCSQLYRKDRLSRITPEDCYKITSDCNSN